MVHRGAATAGGNLAHDSSKANTFPYSTLNLSRGIGYGPAEISLRPLFPAPIINPDNQPAANRDENAGPIDSYATLLFGRNKLDGSTVSGKYGFAPNLNYPGMSVGDAATAGSNYRYAHRRPNWLDDPASVPDSPLWYTGEQASPTLARPIEVLRSSVVLGSVEGQSVGLRHLARYERPLCLGPRLFRATGERGRRTM